MIVNAPRTGEAGKQANQVCPINRQAFDDACVCAGDAVLNDDEREVEKANRVDELQPVVALNALLVNANPMDGGVVKTRIFRIKRKTVREQTRQGCFAWPNPQRHHIHFKQGLRRFYSVVVSCL